VSDIQKNTEESQRKQIERRGKENNRKRRPVQFSVGDKVWLYDNRGSLTEKYRGPCINLGA